ncbi:MAG TPA: M56 family metallopeptidase, partial [Phycisphaerae bacterium]|nr:M56 family metallopeptidase [Phycisphaerae bacterium]
MASLTHLLRTFAGSDAVYRLGWTLLHSLWLGVAVAIALAAALGILRRRSAGARYLAGIVAMMLLVALPVGAFLLVQAPARPSPPDQPLARIVSPPPVTPATAEPPPVVVHPSRPPVAPAIGNSVEPMVPPAQAEPPASAETPVSLPHIQEPTAASATPAETSRPPTLTRAAQAVEPALPWCVLAWVVGVLAMSLWQLAGWLAAARLKRLASRPGDDGILALVARLARQLRVSRPVKVLESVLVRVPTVVGWLRPVILLPVGLATGLTPAQVEAVLAHELAHIRRYDYLVNLLQTLVETLMFYHPAVWFISRRIRAERENCCDDAAVAAGTERFSYAEMLLEVARQASDRARAGGRTGRSTAAAAAVGATGRRPSQLRSRVGRLLGGPAEETSRLARSWPIALLLLAALLIAIPLACRPSVERPAAPTTATARQPEVDLAQPATRPRDEKALPGSDISIGEAMCGEFLFAAVCQADESSPAFSVCDDLGVLEASQTFRIVSVFGSNVQAGQEVRIGYTWFDVPGRWEREIAKGETVIWIAGRQPGWIRGAKAVADTPENRAAVAAAFSRLPPEQTRARPAPTEADVRLVYEGHYWGLLAKSRTILAGKVLSVDWPAGPIGDRQKGVVTMECTRVIRGVREGEHVRVSILRGPKAGFFQQADVEPNTQWLFFAGEGDDRPVLALARTPKGREAIIDEAARAAEIDAMEPEPQQDALIEVLGRPLAGGSLLGR